MNEDSDTESVDLDEESSDNQHQKPSFYNKLLPYYDQIPQESKLLLADIKLNLGKAILYHEFKPGGIRWINSISWFISLYGYDFTKEDHIMFIKVLYEFLTIPNLEPIYLEQTANVLNLLLKKRDLLSRDDLTLPWRPLYKIYNAVIYSKLESFGLIYYPDDIDTVIKTLIRFASAYFSLESTQEMLDEWRPLMCPFDNSINKAMAYFEQFLPTRIPPQHHDKGFKLWFDELLPFWINSSSNVQYDTSLLALFARLSQHNMGHVDWTPHLSEIFTRFMRSFKLPMRSVNVQIGGISNGCGNAVWISTLISSMLGGDNGQCQDKIDKLFKVIESYYHPSNAVGTWSTNLMRFLSMLPEHVMKRVRGERSKKLMWHNYTKEEKKLTDADITRFIQSMLPCVWLAMFHKQGSATARTVLRNFASVRPELVCPTILEKVYPALETLTEPHRLISTLECTTAVARALAYGGPFYSDGPSHIIPLLHCALPGIDQNDLKKCLVTLTFISQIASFVPLVDCSSAAQCRNDIDERELELCMATASLEDFVLQFMDRVFVIVESSLRENTAQQDRGTDETINSEEGLLDMALYSAFDSVLSQSSPQIVDVAIRKLFDFVCGHVMETKVAGKYLASLCRVAVWRGNKEKVLKMFIPTLANTILSCTGTEEARLDERLDGELGFNLLVLTEVIKTNSAHLAPYHDLIIQVLERTLHLQNKEGQRLAARLLQNILVSCSMIRATDYRSLPLFYDQPFDEFFPIREWGKGSSAKTVDIKWQIPTEEDGKLIERLLQEFLIPELELMRRAARKETTMTKVERERCCVIVLACTQAGAVLPRWKMEAVKLTETNVAEFKPIIYHQPITVNLHTASGVKNVRLEVIGAVREFLDYVLELAEDETKTIEVIMGVLRNSIFYFGQRRKEYDVHAKSNAEFRRNQTNTYLGNKANIRSYTIDRTVLQHEGRLMQALYTLRPYTIVHRELAEIFLTLATSYYSQVRKQAQGVLQSFFKLWPNSYKLLLPRIEILLRNGDGVSHEQFKGALHVVLSSKKKCLFTRSDWDTQLVLWPAVIQSKHSEKPSITRILESIILQVKSSFLIDGFERKMSEGALKAAFELAGRVDPTLNAELAINAGRSQLKQWNNKNTLRYEQLTEMLVNLANSGNLHWRLYSACLSLLSFLVRTEVPLPANVVSLFAKNLNHEALKMRKLAISVLASFLKQSKRRHATREIDPVVVKGSGDQVRFYPVDEVRKYGDNRTDNQWLQYRRDDLPCNEASWNETVFVHKTYRGYYGWEKPFEVYSPYECQPQLDRTRSELSEGERAVYDFFTDQANVDKLVGFLSLEDRKGKDKFNVQRYLMFKGLARNYGDMFLDKFIPCLREFVASKNENEQRCAAEILTGFCRGMKHWPYAKISSFWSNHGLELFRVAISNVTVETEHDWVSCLGTVSADRDPRHIHWIIELLMDKPLSHNSGSFGDSVRLGLLKSVLNQQEWRVAELLHRVKTYLVPYLAHPYNAVRDRVGYTLSVIYFLDLKMDSLTPTQSPHRDDFIRDLIPRLRNLTKEFGCENLGLSLGDADEKSKEGFGQTQAGDFSMLMMGDAQSQPGPVSDCSGDTIMAEPGVEKTNGNGTSEHEKVVVNLMKTICKFVMLYVIRSTAPISTELFHFLPLLSQLESYEKDEGLKQEALGALACIGQSYLTIPMCEQAISGLSMITKLASWKARLVGLTYLQLMVFGNFFTVTSRREWLDSITQLVFQLLEDEQIEVRVRAGATLEGLFQSGIVEPSEALLNVFKTKCNARLSKAKTVALSDVTLGSTGLSPVSNGVLPSSVNLPVIQRHAGIIGLCSFVAAYPYDVPQQMPDILMLLGNHLHDPEPIPTTIKQTLSNFKRTHHDSWRDHKLKFDDDQLAVLADLLISPSYYA